MFYKLQLNVYDLLSTWVCCSHRRIHCLLFVLWVDLSRDSAFPQLPPHGFLKPWCYGLSAGLWAISISPRVSASRESKKRSDRTLRYGKLHVCPECNPFTTTRSDYRNYVTPPVSPTNSLSVTISLCVCLWPYFFHIWVFASTVTDLHALMFKKRPMEAFQEGGGCERTQGFEPFADHAHAPI